MRRRVRSIAFVVLLVLPLLCSAQAPGQAAAGFTLQQVLDYPFPQGLTAAERGNRIAWVVNLRGVRNVWIAEGPAFKPKQVTHFTKDDGQEITDLTFSPSGDALAFVRGGDHDANWPAEGDLPPDPASLTDVCHGMLFFEPSQNCSRFGSLAAALQLLVSRRSVAVPPETRAPPGSREFTFSSILLYQRCRFGSLLSRYVT